MYSGPEKHCSATRGPFTPWNQPSRNLSSAESWALPTQVPVALLRPADPQELCGLGAGCTYRLSAPPPSRDSESTFEYNDEMMHIQD